MYLNSSYTKQSFPLFFFDLKTTTNNKDNIDLLCHLKIEIEEPRANRTNQSNVFVTKVSVILLSSIKICPLWKTSLFKFLSNAHQPNALMVWWPSKKL